MSFELFEHNPLTGMTTLFDYDEMTDTAIFKTMQEVSPILDLNHAHETDSSQGWRGKENNFWKVASIPAIVQEEWMTKYGVDVFNEDHLEAAKRLLNSNEYRRLKTAPVTV